MLGTLPTYSAQAALRDACRSLFRPRDPLTVSEWSDRYRRLGQSSSAEPGPWRTARTPYLREVMDAMDTPGVRRVTFQKCSQVGGTEALYNGLLHVIAHYAGTTLFSYPNDKLATYSNTKRLHPAVLACRPVIDKLEGRANDLKVDQLAFKGHTVVFIGGGTPTNFQSRPARVCFADELDRFADPDESIEQLVSRTATYGESGLVVDASTPTHFEVGIHAQYLKSDRRRYFVPCPSCGHYHALAFPNLRWEGGSKATPEEGAATAYMVCPACDGPIYDRHKPAMLAAGIWVPAGQDVLVDGEGRPALVGEADRPNSAHRGYHINQLYSPWVPFGGVVRKFLDNNAIITEVFVNEVLGEPWQAAADRIESHELAPLKIPVSSGGYLLKNAPEQVDLLVRAIDVQKDTAWVLVLAIGLGGRLLAVVDAERLPAQPGARLAELDGLFDREYRTQSTRRVVPCVVTAIDHGHRSDEVESFLERAHRRGHKVFAVKGSNRPYADAVRRAEIRVHRHTKKLRERPLELFHVGGDHWADHLAGSIQFSLAIARMATEKQAGLFDEKKMQETEGVVFRLPEDAPAFLLDQLTSEHRVQRVRNGRSVSTWELRPGRDDNHLLDCVRYALALSSAFHLDRRRATAASAAPVRGRLVF